MPVLLTSGREKELVTVRGFIPCTLPKNECMFRQLRQQLTTLTRPECSEDSAYQLTTLPRPDPCEDSSYQLTTRN
jgi:hypothetical protein